MQNIDGIYKSQSSHLAGLLSMALQILREKHVGGQYKMGN